MKIGADFPLLIRESIFPPIDIKENIMLYNWMFSRKCMFLSSWPYNKSLNAWHTWKHNLSISATQRELWGPTYFITFTQSFLEPKE